MIGRPIFTWIVWVAVLAHKHKHKKKHNSSGRPQLKQKHVDKRKMDDCHISGSILPWKCEKIANGFYTLMSYSSAFSRDTSIRTTETKFLFCLCLSLSSWPPPTTVCLCSRLCLVSSLPCALAYSCVVDVLTTVCLSSRLCWGPPHYRVPVLILVLWASVLTTFFLCLFLCYKRPYCRYAYACSKFRP